MNREDAHRAYDCVRRDFPSFVNFEGCPWVETIDRTWVRSNAGYSMEVTAGEVRVSGPVFDRTWAVSTSPRELSQELSEAPIG